MLQDTRRNPTFQFPNILEEKQNKPKKPNQPTKKPKSDFICFLSWCFLGFFFFYSAQILWVFCCFLILTLKEFLSCCTHTSRWEPSWCRRRGRKERFQKRKKTKRKIKISANGFVDFGQSKANPSGQSNSQISSQKKGGGKKENTEKKNNNNNNNKAKWKAVKVPGGTGRNFSSRSIVRGVPGSSLPAPDPQQGRGKTSRASPESPRASSSAPQFGEGREESTATPEIIPEIPETPKFRGVLHSFGFFSLLKSLCFFLLEEPLPSLHSSTTPKVLNSNIPGGNLDPTANPSANPKFHQQIQQQSKNPTANPKIHHQIQQQIQQQIPLFFFLFCLDFWFFCLLFFFCYSLPPRAAVW